MYLLHCPCSLEISLTSQFTNLHNTPTRSEFHNFSTQDNIFTSLQAKYSPLFALEGKIKILKWRLAQPTPSVKHPTNNSWLRHRRLHGVDPISSRFDYGTGPQNPPKKIHFFTAESDTEPPEFIRFRRGTFPATLCDALWPLSSATNWRKYWQKIPVVTAVVFAVLEKSSPSSKQHSIAVLLLLLLGDTNARACTNTSERLFWLAMLPVWHERVLHELDVRWCA